MLCRPCPRAAVCARASVLTGRVTGMAGDEMRGLGKQADGFNYVQEGFNRSKMSLTLDL